MNSLPLHVRLWQDIRDYSRMAWWPAAALGLLLLLDRPEQVDVLLYKAVLVTFAAWLGYWVDRHLFKYARPHEQTSGTEFNSATLRRAIIVSAVVLAFATGL